MKKVTLQEIANSLGISRTTVWKVFSGHEGVSDSLRTKVIAKAQELGYAIPEDFQYPQSARRPRRSTLQLPSADRKPHFSG